MWTEIQNLRSEAGKTHICVYIGNYIKLQFEFLVLEIKPWHFVKDSKPYYSIPFTLHCTDTCGDVWQRFCVSTQINQDVWVAKEYVAIDYTRVEKPYNLQMKVYCDRPMPKKEVKVDVGFSICGNPYERTLMIRMEDGTEPCFVPPRGGDK